MFDIFRAVECLLGDLAGRLLLHQALVTDNRLVGNGTAHVVDGTAAWDHCTEFALVTQNIFRYVANAHIEQQRYVGMAEHSPLLMRLMEETTNLREADRDPFPFGLHPLDILHRNQVEDDWYESGVIDAFVPRRRIIDCDSRPQNLPRFESAARWVKALVESVDLVGKEPTDRGTEGSRELDVQEMA